MFTFLTFGLKILFDLLWEWLTLFPKSTDFPHTSHFATDCTSLLNFDANDILAERILNCKLFIHFYYDLWYNARNTGLVPDDHPMDRREPMKGRISNRLGEVNISEDVIATYAGSVAVECFGVVGMAVINTKDGLAMLLRKDRLDRGISVSIKDNVVSLKMHIIVAYGVSISAVADNLIENVRYKVEEFTGMKVGTVEIFVEGVKPID